MSTGTGGTVADETHWGAWNADRSKNTPPLARRGVFCVGLDMWDLGMEQAFIVFLNDALLWNRS